MKLNKHQCFSPAGISFHSIVSVQLIPTVLLLLFTKTSITITIVHTFVIDCSRATVTNDASSDLSQYASALQHSSIMVGFAQEKCHSNFLKKISKTNFSSHPFFHCAPCVTCKFRLF